MIIVILEVIFLVMAMIMNFLIGQFLMIIMFAEIQVQI